MSSSTDSSPDPPATSLSLVRQSSRAVFLPLISHRSTTRAAVAVLTLLTLFSSSWIERTGADTEDCEATLNSCITRNITMVQSSDANSPNIMCCRAAVMTDCLVKKRADRECSGVSGYEDVPQRIRRSLTDPSEVFKITALLYPMAGLPGSGGIARAARPSSLARRVPLDVFSPSDCREFQFVDGRISARCDTMGRLMPDNMRSRV